MVGDPASLGREFCALVLSIRRPLEDELADGAALSTARRERLRTLHRNIMRLFQLANALLDVAGPEPAARRNRTLVDLAAETMVIPMLRAGDPAAVRADRDGEDGRAPERRRRRASREIVPAGHAVSRELRDPLRAVAGFSQVLLDGHAHALDRDGRDLVEQIHASARRMAEIVEDLLVPPPP